jgi:glutaredoxin
MIFVTLFTREGCHLCEDVKRDLQDLRAEFPHELVEIDIDSNPELSRKIRPKSLLLKLDLTH